jgi:hypothetical protein
MNRNIQSLFGRSPGNDIDIPQRVSDRRLLALVRRMLTAGVVMPDGTHVLAD